MNQNEQGCVCVCVCLVEVPRLSYVWPFVGFIDLFVLFKMLYAVKKQVSEYQYLRHRPINSICHKNVNKNEKCKEHFNVCLNTN